MWWLNRQMGLNSSVPNNQTHLTIQVTSVMRKKSRVIFYLLQYVSCKPCILLLRLFFFKFRQVFTYFDIFFYLDTSLSWQTSLKTKSNKNAIHWNILGCLPIQYTGPSRECSHQLRCQVPPFESAGESVIKLWRTRQIPLWNNWMSQRWSLYLL